MDGPLAGLVDQQGQAVQGVLPVLLLGPEPAGLNEKDTLFGESLSGKASETPLDLVREGRGSAHVESQSDCSGDLVDVLTSGPGGPEELELKLLGVYLHTRRHDSPCAPGRQV